jgi:excisionase family DNA binding protein
MCAAYPTISGRYEPLLTPAEAGAYLKVHPKTAIRSARQGGIPALRYGKHWRFRKPISSVRQSAVRERDPDTLTIKEMEATIATIGPQAIRVMVIGCSHHSDSPQ